jgi:hypothetical protein
MRPELDGTNSFSHALQSDFRVLVALQARELLSPFDEQDAVGGEQVVEGEGFQFALGVNAIEINVIEGDAGPAIFVDQGEGGAGYVFRSSGLEPFGNSLDQGRFSGSEIAAEKDDERRSQVEDEFPSEGDCLVGRVGGGFACHPTETV